MNSNIVIYECREGTPPSKILIDFADVFKLLNNNYQMYENLDNFPPRVPGDGIQLSFRLN